MPNNQQYIEEIIKVAQQGDYACRNIEWYGCQANITHDIEDLTKLVFFDPNFFKAIGKVKGWFVGEICDERGNCKRDDEYIKNMHTFLDKIIEKDLDHAIEWLYNLIKE